jgi:site-specific DNA recombinase
LIERVVLMPDTGSPDGLGAELHGALATILTLAANPADNAKRRAGRIDARKEDVPGTVVPVGQLSVVAGIGFEPMTFRL